MKKLLAAAAAISALIVGSAQAQEWSGYYIGANVGYGTGDDTTTERNDGSGTATGFTHDFDVDGYTIGGYAGARWDVGGWYLGVEGDIDWANMEGGYRVAGPDGTDLETNWLGSIRGVAGVPMGNWLIYGTAGVSFGDLDYTYVNNGVGESISDSSTGWTAGLGAEWQMFGGHPRVEVRYTDLGDLNLNSTTAFPAYNYDQEPAFTSVRFGMAWGLN